MRSEFKLFEIVVSITFTESLLMHIKDPQNPTNADLKPTL
jgi:hypothetical protein